MPPESRQQVAFFTRAIEQAELSECRVRVGAVVVKAGRLVGAAPNKTYNDPAYLDDDVALAYAAICAERRALAQVPDSVAKGAVIYVARIKRDGTLGVSKPCSRCQLVMDAAGIKRAYYVPEGIDFRMPA